VVGPNGCGKSNLVEALRWVMGETSHKSLRASGMDDVIFNGTNNRPARNNAEVTLFLDNSDRSAPAQFNEEETLEVARRIEREKGSNYRLNGREVRARDVQLLLPTPRPARAPGAGASGAYRRDHPGQARAAPPRAGRSRRRSGLHARRHEAELRLKAAETNLGRLEDVIGQLAQQMDALKRQARQAVKYRQVSATSARPRRRCFTYAGSRRMPKSSRRRMPRQAPSASLPRRPRCRPRPRRTRRLRPPTCRRCATRRRAPAPRCSVS